MKIKKKKGQIREASNKLGNYENIYFVSTYEAYLTGKTNIAFWMCFGKSICQFENKNVTISDLWKGSS